VAGVSPAEWRAYLYLRRNPAGWTAETWFHRFGCARFFVAERNTVTNEFRAIRLAGTARNSGSATNKEDEAGGLQDPSS
jgi:heterotetrameric sarcosine oxidase delta subunit